MGLAVYQVNGGDSPQVFIRINSKMRLERIVHAPDKYENIILKNVKDRHYISVKMLKYLFENQIDTNKFWDLVEDYFLGHIPESIN
jgi:ATP-dependent DNA helicase RecQ